MKYIIEKDKKTRKKIQAFEKKNLILKSIQYNVNFFNITRWKANTLASFLPSRSSKTFISNRCVNTINKKKFNKLTNFSRMVFLKLARSRDISNLYRSSW